MKVIFIHKGTLTQFPPDISAILILSELGHEVTLIDEGVNDYWKDRLSKMGVGIYEVLPRYHGYLGRFLDYISFRLRVRKLLNIIVNDKDDTVLWVEGAPAILALGKVLKQYRYLLHILELHENRKYQLRAIGNDIHQAEVVFMPEYTRTVLYQLWFKTKVRPVVLPNKPYFIPSEQDLKDLKLKYSELVKLFESKKVILYQGHVSNGRDLTTFVKAIKELGSDYVFCLMGTDHGVLKEWKKIDSSIIHIDYIPAPEYLLMTSLCYIGILGYNPYCLNSMFCAPNKLYEYAAFGKPMLGNDIPGLQVIENRKIGKVVDENNIESIKESIKQIEENYSSYSRNSWDFYLNTDNKEVIRQSLKSLVK